MLRRVLVVDGDQAFLRLMQSAIAHLADVDTCTDFETARKQLFDRPPELLVTNVRLGPYNGLHLVLLAAAAHLSTRCVTYGSTVNPTDMALAREAQTLGAFFEPFYRVRYALPSYVPASLPSRDRRDPTRVGRRLIFRGGRRATDLTPVRLSAEGEAMELLSY